MLGAKCGCNSQVLGLLELSTVLKRQTILLFVRQLICVVPNLCPSPTLPAGATESQVVCVLVTVAATTPKLDVFVLDDQTFEAANFHVFTGLQQLFPFSTKEKIIGATRIGLPPKLLGADSFNLVFFLCCSAHRKGGGWSQSRHALGPGEHNKRFGPKGQSTSLLPSPCTARGVTHQ